MKVWFRAAGLAGGALLVVGLQVGAQIREIVPGGEVATPRPGLVARPGHPVVLLHTREGEFVGGERTVTQIMFKRLDPKAAVSKISPPEGIDGIIAYPRSRLLEVRGTKAAVAGYRASLEKLDRESRESETAAPAAHPVITVAAAAKLALKADRVESEGETVRATGHVVIGLANGIELRAQAVRITTAGGKKRIEVEK